MQIAGTTAPVDNHTRLLARYQHVRQFTKALCEPLSAEDCIVQSMPDASPIRWHLAHTTWFFETFVLKRFAGYRPYHDDFEYLFNSYYNAVGEQFPRPLRGMMTRPTCDEIWDYRSSVDSKITELLENANSETLAEIADILETGLQHEQQHQELMLTDMKHAFSCNPLLPAYHARTGNVACQNESAVAAQWQVVDEGIYEVGHSESSFAFDNESPRHRTFIHEFNVADRLVTSGEYLEFMQDRGYERPELWLSMGWTFVNEQKWRSPQYWRCRDGDWHEFTLSGERRLDLAAPVCHVSYFEADAFARWSGKRLPTEFEWEVAANSCSVEGNFADTRQEGIPIHPTRPSSLRSGDGNLHQMFGDVWEWTASQYMPYPGFVAASGALGEYNGKFMCNQFVLRGGSCATSRSHIRQTYRNFFPPQARWQFTGIRLAE